MNINNKIDLYYIKIINEFKNKIDLFHIKLIKEY